MKRFTASDNRCATCLNSRANVTADCVYYVCTLSEKQNLDCLMGAKDSYDGTECMTRATIEFDVIDNKTGCYPDLFEIALNEDWAKHLMYCDMCGFAIHEDGSLILLDECGAFAYCPEGRFTVIFGKAGAGND